MIHYFQPEGYKKYYVCSDNEVDESSEEDKCKNDDLQESTSESDSDFSLSNDETISDTSSSESEVEELLEDMKKNLKVQQVEKSGRGFMILPNGKKCRDTLKFLSYL